VLTPLSGYSDCQGNDVNNAGLVAGASYSTSAVGTKWVNGVSGSQLPAGVSEATAVNDSGHFVGYLSLGISLNHGFFYNGTVLTDIHNATLSTVGNFSTATDVNSAGQVVGWAATSGSGLRSAFLWQNGSAILLGKLGGRESAPLSVNNHGQVAGYLITAGLLAQGFLWTDSNGNNMSDAGEMIALPDTGIGSTANAVNDSGHAVGFVLNSSGQRLPVAWYDTGNYTPLPLVSGTTTAEAADINSTGAIVGLSGGKGATLWTNNQAYNLNDLTTLPSGYKMTHAHGINDLGWIVGAGFLSGTETGFLLIPVPEPGSMAMLIFSSIAVLCQRRIFGIRRVGLCCRVIASS
jgi:probable HAF family extracellular repeat protein